MRYSRCSPDRRVAAIPTRTTSGFGGSGRRRLARTGRCLASGYRVCAALLRDHRLGKTPERLLSGAGYADWLDRPSLRMMFTSMLMVNPPAHTRLRRLVSGAFTPRRVAALRPAVERRVAELCEQVAGQTDFVSTFAFPLPVAVIGEMLGVPAADRPMFQSLVRDWSMVLEVLSPLAVDQADAAAVQIRDYLDALAAQRRAHPKDDLISALVGGADDGDRLNDEELATTAALLLAAGFETTTGLLANGLLALLTYPDQARRLRERPELAQSAVDEMLRYDSPAQMVVSRGAAADLHVADLTLVPGQRIIALVGAANRDPEMFSEPDRLRLDRTEAAPLSFGGGIHYCLGAPLAHLEAEIAFPALLSRFTHLDLAGTPVRRDGSVLRGCSALPVTAQWGCDRERACGTVSARARFGRRLLRRAALQLPVSQHDTYQQAEQSRSGSSARTTRAVCCAVRPNPTSASTYSVTVANPQRFSSRQNRTHRW